ncbi:unnamed protein product [Owenia fusiformis]|uniref:WxxW domain-containing protein n=1 Tax=Owenia fusiformis TaxID=6347 RepID=A0A8S4NPX7_OWEFU|nr:unnamed protein product [Owenia fusiformis]
MEAAANDCRNICNEKGSWMPYVSVDTPSGGNDIETTQHWENKIVNNGDTALGAKYCKDRLAPLAMEARVVGTETPAKSTGQMFAKYSSEEGFLCSNEDQFTGGPCVDYEVRYFCPNVLEQAQSKHLVKNG